MQFDAVFACLAAFALYALGYTFYARYLAEKVFSLDPGRETPAHTERDEVDYVPTPKSVLYGHHFASITGLAPMLGPAVAVIWGWLPALLWVVFGALFIGCVHDFGSLVVSIRARGMSIGKVAEGVIGKRTKSLFHLIIFFGVALAMGVFVFVIARLFREYLALPTEAGPGVPGYPQAIIPSFGVMGLAVVVGWLSYKKGVSLRVLAAVAFVLQLGLVWLGSVAPVVLPVEHGQALHLWIYILLGYALLASVLPVWVLLQPRDFINSLLLYLGLGLLYAGFFAGAPSFVAPAVNLTPEGAPNLFPFVFIVIACGSVSGFHSLVSSGTTAKQLANEADARPVGYGGMVGESLLGLMSVLACTAGVGQEKWATSYASWDAIDKVKLGTFIEGCAEFLTQLAIPRSYALAFIAVVVVSFALTTLDSATRLLRYNIEEIAESLGVEVKGPGKVLAALIGCGAIAFFALFEIGGKPAGLVLWTLFGTTNQLLAGLALLTITLYLKQRGRQWWWTGVPCVGVLATTVYAMTINLRGFYAGPNASPLLLVIGGVLLLLAVWVAVEGLLRFFRGDEPHDELAVFPHG